jgi:hypothetical protein
MELTPTTPSPKHEVAPGLRFAPPVILGLLLCAVALVGLGSAFLVMLAEGSHERALDLAACFGAQFLCGALACGAGSEPPLRKPAMLLAFLAVAAQAALLANSPLAIPLAFGALISLASFHAALARHLGDATLVTQTCWGYQRPLWVLLATVTIGLVAGWGRVNVLGTSGTALVLMVLSTCLMWIYVHLIVLSCRLSHRVRSLAYGPKAGAPGAPGSL